jgi:hypothetical protein
MERLPQLALLRVLSDGGPYRRDDMLSLAFSDAAICRVAAHYDLEGRAKPSNASIVPDAILAAFLVSASPYERNETVVIAFIDPALARIVRLAAPTAAPSMAITDGVATVESIVEHVDAPASQPMTPGQASLLLLLRWSADDARRFIAVVDKLFTVDRLGWYRHTLALRLLLADALALDGEISTEANRRLEAVRSIAADALNAPLLSAFMPQFGIDAAWLDSIEPPSLGKAVSILRKCIEPYVRETAATIDGEEAMLQGTILRHEWDAAPATSLDAFLPLLIPQRALDRNVAQRLLEYRAALIELFSQMAQTSRTVRLKQMTTANHVLDERLWNLAGALQDAFGARVA